MSVSELTRVKNSPMVINGEQKDPSTTIAAWRNMLLQDVRAGLTIDSYRVMKLLSSFSQAELDSIAGEIISNFNIELNIPPGKVSLATFKDSLETIMPHYSAKHILVLLYSISNKPRAEGTLQQRNTRIIGTPLTSRIMSVDPPPQANECVEPITIGSGADQIIFKVPLSVHRSSEQHKLMEKLNNIYRIISRLNALIPQNPVSSIDIIDGEGGSYDEKTHLITVGIDEVDPVHTAVHEMGHAIGYVLIGGEYLKTGHYFIMNDKVWQNLFFMSLKNGSYELFDDNNYYLTGDDTGHPFDDSWELFASALAAYVLHPEELIKNINDPDNKPYTKNVGRLVFCYLRDRVFKGATFCKNDPFKNINFESLRSLISEVSTDTFVELFCDTSSEVRRAAMRAVVSYPVMDDRYISPLILAIQDNEDLGMTRCAARDAIVTLKDKRFIPLLQDISRTSKISEVRSSALETLWHLGVK